MDSLDKAMILAQLVLMISGAFLATGFAVLLLQIFSKKFKKWIKQYRKIQ